MSESNQLCGGKRRCTRLVVIACQCSDSVTFLCKTCASSHFLEKRPHLFLQLDKAKELLNESISNLSPKYLEIKASLLAYINRLKDFKARISAFKSDIVEDIEKAAHYKNEDIDKLINQASVKLTEITTQNESLDGIDKTLAKRYDTLGVRGVIDSYAETLALNEIDVKQAILNMITIDKDAITHQKLEETQQTIITLQQFNSQLAQTKHQLTTHFQEENLRLRSQIQQIKQDIQSLNQISIKDTTSFPLNSASSCIFAAKNGTKELIKYDIDLDSLTSYDLSSSIPQYFISSPACILPSGEVLVVCGYPYYGETYKIDTSKSPPECINLGILNHSRSSSRLILHNDFIYLLGGCSDPRKSSKKAERMRINDWSWNVMPDMIEARQSFGVYIQANRIYCIGGRWSSSIEYYDTNLNTFNLLSNLQAPNDAIVCGIYDDKIYAVSVCKLRVYSKDFQIIESINSNYLFTFCYSNVRMKGNKIVYVNSSNEGVYSFDVNTRVLSLVKEF